MPIKERYVWICTNRRPDGHSKGSCAAKGSERLKDELKAACHEAGIGGSVRVNTSGCMDLCEHGVSLAVMPEHTMLGGFVREDIPALVEALRTPGGASKHPLLAARRLSVEGTEAPRKLGVVDLERKPKS